MTSIAGRPLAGQVSALSVELERLTRVALEHLGLDAKTMDRCKNSSPSDVLLALQPLDGLHGALD